MPRIPPIDGSRSLLLLTDIDGTDLLWSWEMIGDGALVAGVVDEAGTVRDELTGPSRIWVSRPILLT